MKHYHHHYYLLIILALTLVSFFQISSYAQEDRLFSGLVYSPFQKHHIDNPSLSPTVDEIEYDIALLSGIANNLRIYDAGESLNLILDAAQKYNVTIHIGVDLVENNNENESKIRQMLYAVNENPEPVGSIIVGKNELYYGTVSSTQLVDYITMVKDNMSQHDIPISSLNWIDVWQDPKLSEIPLIVDYIIYDDYQFWPGTSIEYAAQKVMTNYSHLQDIFPDKTIIVETGWPHGKDIRLDAVPSRANQEYFLNEFNALAKENNIDYFLFEAFDEPWKQEKNLVDVTVTSDKLGLPVHVTVGDLKHAQDFLDKLQSEVGQGFRIGDDASVEIIETTNDAERFYGIFDFYRGYSIP